MWVLDTAETAKTIQDLTGLGVGTLGLEVNRFRGINVCKEKVQEVTGRGMDYLVNNAGSSEQVIYEQSHNCAHNAQIRCVPAIDADFSEMESVLATNFSAVVRLCQTFMPLLRRSQGTIVQIGSAAAYIPYAWGSIDKASTAALPSYSAALRRATRWLRCSIPWHNRTSTVFKCAEAAVLFSYRKHAVSKTRSE